MIMRLRTLNPRVFLHRRLHELEEKTGMPMIRIFMGLWCASDREGLFPWTEDLKAVIAPYDDIDFMAALDALEKARFIASYWHDGKQYGRVNTFKTHQVVNNREAPSRLPNPDLANGVRSRRTAIDQETLTLPGLEDVAASTQQPRKPAGKEIPLESRSWSYRAIAYWGDRFGGQPPAGKITKFLKPLIDKYGAEPVLAAWQLYLKHKDAEFAQPSDFASHYARWTPEGIKAAPSTNGRRGTPPVFEYTQSTTLPPEQD